MTNEMKTPLEIVREVWAGLEWYRYNGVNLQAERITATVARYDIDIYGPDESDHTWHVYVDGERFQDADLRIALQQARDATAKRLRKALALCEPATTTALDLTLHIDRPKGAVWALHGLGQIVRFGPPGAMNAEVHLPALADLGRDDVEQVREVILEHLCGGPTPSSETVRALRDIADRLRRGEDVEVGGVQLGPPPLPVVARQALMRPPGHVDAVPEREPYPVPVAFHPNGEAVLMLTSMAQGHAVVIPERHLTHYQAEPDSTREHTLLYSRVSTYHVMESATDIRRTLEMLAERAGGGE